MEDDAVRLLLLVNEEVLLPLLSERLHLLQDDINGARDDPLGRIRDGGTHLHHYYIEQQLIVLL